MFFLCDTMKLLIDKTFVNAHVSKLCIFVTFFFVFFRGNQLLAFIEDLLAGSGEAGEVERGLVIFLVTNER